MMITLIKYYYDRLVARLDEHTVIDSRAMYKVIVFYPDDKNEESKATTEDLHHEKTYVQLRNLKRDDRNYIKQKGTLQETIEISREEAETIANKSSI